MARRKVLLVEPAEGGGWSIVDGEKHLEHFLRKRDATIAGRDLLRRLGGGELLIRNVSGRLTEKDSVPAS